MDYETYESIRSYAYTDLAKYIDTGISAEIKSLSVRIAGGIGRMKAEMDAAKRLYLCDDLTPREKNAAHLLAVVSNARAIAHQRDAELVDNPAPALDGMQQSSLDAQIRKAVYVYSAFLPKHQRKALRSSIGNAAAMGITSPDDKQGVATPGTAPAPKESTEANKSPVDVKPQKQREQEKAILKTISQLGFKPLQLPPNKDGLPGIKSRVFSSLSKNPLFGTKGVFDKAWDRLSSFNDINYMA